MTSARCFNTVDQVLSSSVRQGGRCWSLTALATLASTWALEAGATATGVLLVTSGLLHGQPQTAVVGVLVASYAIWTVGLRSNLSANARLLAATGTSTNLLSKLAHDVAVRRSTRARVRRNASAAGYVASEVAKEVPYYLGALGAAFWSDSLAATDALIFLAGTNIGAAAYEFGVARSTRAWLCRRPARVVVADPTNTPPRPTRTDPTPHRARGHLIAARFASFRARSVRPTFP